jgi:hypothetical protein
MLMAGTEDIPINNGEVLNILQKIRAVMSLAAEGKLGALFTNAKTAVSMQGTLKKMGHPQTRTFIQTNNSTAHTLLTNKILPKALKAVDMQFHWFHHRKAQDQYHFYWRLRTQILADYWTKHHPAIHHKAFWPQILTLSTTDCENSKVNTPKNTATKSFIKKILSTPSFVEQLAVKQRIIAAKGA